MRKMSPPTFSFHWLIGTIVFGIGGGLMVGWIFASFRATLQAILSMGAIGIIFSVVMWGGSILGTRLLMKLPDRGTPSWLAARFFMGWSVVFCVCMLLASWLIRQLLGINLFTRMTLGVSSLIGLSIAGLVMGYYFLRDQIQISRELALSQARAQSLALKAQLSPHTLFNSLNTVAALIPEQPAQAEEAVRRLSRLLRKILAALEQEHWSLDEEFALLRDLLDMEQSRFGERLSYRLELPEAMRECPLPPLLLLPLVENSLKHGFRAKVGACGLSVVAEGHRIVITDDGVGRSEGAEEGVGLRTVRQRLEAMGGTFAWLPTASGTCCEVRLAERL